MENLIGKSFKTLVRTDGNGDKTVEILPNLKGEEMKRINFREVNKKLNSLKKAASEYKFNFLTSEFASEQEKVYADLIHQAHYELEQFRNTKISLGFNKSCEGI